MVVYNCDTGCGAWTTQMVGKNKLALNKSGKGHFWKHVFSQAPSTSENCAHCGMKTHMAGPMYAGPLHSPAFIKKILDGLPSVSKDTYHTTERIEGMLTLALEESLPPLEEGIRFADPRIEDEALRSRRARPLPLFLHPVCSCQGPPLHHTP